MTEWHPDRRTLERFLEDQLPEEQSRTIQRHIFTCAGCEQRLISILPALPGCGNTSGAAAPPAVSEYRDLVRQVLREARLEGEQRRARLAAERKEAGRLWREVRALDLAARREMVWESPRFQSWGFFELLLDKARWTVLEEPQKAEEMLRLALDVAEHLDPATYGPGSVASAKARAWASLGNTLR
ncbi:MAG: hypothetical protein ACLGI9_20800, partial [Thermoanaerobaculia bacterium]